MYDIIGGLEETGKFKLDFRDGGAIEFMKAVNIAFRNNPRIYIYISVYVCIYIYACMYVCTT